MKMTETKKWTTIFCSFGLLCLLILGIYMLHINNSDVFMIIMFAGDITFIIGIYNITNGGG